jgi:hypothetical protein
VIDLEQLRAEQAGLGAEVAMLADEIEIQTARRDRAEARLRLVADLVRLAELYAGLGVPEADEIPL